MFRYLALQSRFFPEAKAARAARDADAFLQQLQAPLQAPHAAAAAGAEEEEERLAEARLAEELAARSAARGGGRQCAPPREARSPPPPPQPPPPPEPWHSPPQPHLAYAPGPYAYRIAPLEQAPQSQSTYEEDYT